jgi:hypothetical protein
MDRRLREAQRSGDGVAVLRARLRLGEVSHEQIELAASLGHVDALMLCPDVERSVLLGSAVRRASLLVLEQTLPSRVAADWAERALPAWETKHPEEPAPRHAIAAARSWAECPSETRMRHASAAARAAHDAASAVSATFPDVVSRAMHAAHAAAHAAKTSVSALARFAVTNTARSSAHAASSNDATKLAEEEWQRLRLAAYVLGEIEFPRSRTGSNLG